MRDCIATASSVAALFSVDGFVLQNGRAPVRGRDAIAKAYAGQAGGDLRLRALAYAVADTTGYIIGAYAYGDAAGDIGKFTVTLRRSRGGRWEIFSDMDNGNQPRRQGTPSPAAQNLSLSKPHHIGAEQLREFADSLAAAAERAGRSVPGRPLGRDSAFALFLLRRDTSSAPEVHERVAEMFVAQAGSATVFIGGRVEGARLMEPGEWNGGRIVSGDSDPNVTPPIRRALKPGDVVVIPAGVPHQVEVAPGEFVTYLVVKFRNPSPIQ